MVKDKDKLEHLDNWDRMESDFDIDFNFDTIDSDSDRKPTRAIKAGLVSGFKSTAKNLAPALATGIGRAMPHTERNVSEVMRSISDINRLRQDFQSDIDPHINQLKQTAKKISGRYKESMPKSIAKFIDSLEVEEKQQSYNSTEEFRTSGIQQTTAEIFKLEQEQKLKDKAEQKAENLINEKLESSRHDEHTRYLRDIRIATMTQSNFTKSTQIAFMKKDLELKYRHLYVSQDILASVQTTAKMMEQKLEEIRHNSSLPDIQKKKGMENLKETIKGRISGNITDTLANFTDKLKQNIKTRIFDSMKSAISGVSMAADMAEQSASMMEGMGDMMDPKTMKYEMGGDLAGQGIASLIANGMFGGGGLTGKLFKKVAPYAADMETKMRHGKAKGLYKVKSMKDKATHGDYNLKNMAVANLLSLIPGFNTGPGRIENTLFNNPLEATSFDVATRQSIVEIIPGYLAKILKVQQDYATGTNNDELIYDPKKRDFVTSTTFKKNALDMLTYSESNRTYRSAELLGEARGLAGVNKNVKLKTFDDYSKDITRILLNMATGPYLFDKDSFKEFTMTANGADAHKVIFSNVKEPATLAGIILSLISNPSGQFDPNAANRLNNAILDSIDNDRLINGLADLTNSFGHGRHLKDLLNDDLSIKSDGMTNAYLNNVNKEQFTSTVNWKSNSLYHELTGRNKIKNELTNEHKDNKIISKLYNKLNKLTGTDFNPEHGDFSEYTSGSIGGVSENDFIETAKNRKRKRPSSKNPNNVSDCCEELKSIFMKPIDVNIVNSGKNKMSKLTTSDNQDIIKAIDAFKEEFIKYAEEHKDSTSVLRSIQENSKNYSENFGTFFDSFKSWSAETNLLSLTQMEFLKNINPNLASKDMMSKTKSLMGNIRSGSSTLMGKGIDAYKAIALGTMDLSKQILFGAGKRVDKMGSFIGDHLPGFMGGAKELGLKSIGVYGDVLSKSLGGAGKLLSGMGKLVTGRSFSKMDRPVFCDIYLKGKVEIGNPLISKKKFEQGLIFMDGSVVTSSYDINQPIIDPETKQTIITKEDIETGLITVDGEEATSSMAGSLLKGGRGLLKKGMGLAGKLTGGLSEIYPKSLNFGLDIGKDMYSGAKKLGKRLFGMTEEDSVKSKMMEDIIGVRLDKIYDLLVDRLEDNTDRAGSYKDYERKKKVKGLGGNTTKGSKSNKINKLTDILPGGAAIAEGSSFMTDYVEMKLMEKFGGKAAGFLGNAKSKVGGLIGGLGGKLGGLASSAGGKAGGLLKLLLGGGALAGLGGMTAGGIAGSLPSNKLLADMIPSDASKMANKTVDSLKGSKALDAMPDSKKTSFFGSLLKKFQNILPTKFQKFFKPGIVSSLMNKIGKTGIAKIIAKFATPIGWAIAAGLAAWACIKGYNNAEEIMGVTEHHKELTMGDKLTVGAANATSETFTLGLVSSTWIAEQMGVAVKMNKTDEKNTDKEDINVDSPDKKMNDIKNLSVEPSKEGNAATSRLSQIVASKQPTNYRLPNASMNTSIPQSPMTTPHQGSNLKTISPRGNVNFSGGLGSLSAQFESGAQGSAAIGWDVGGGTSYGKYQIASRTGTFNEFLSWLNKQGKEGQDVAMELSMAGRPDTGSINGQCPDTWRKLAKEGRIQKFEHDFIKEKLYDVCLRKLPPAIKSMVDGSKLLQDVLWSTAVHHGPGGKNIQKGAWVIFVNSYSPGISLIEYIRNIYRIRTEMYPKAQSRLAQELALALSQVGNESYGQAKDTMVSGNIPNDAQQDAPKLTTDQSGNQQPQASAGAGTSYQNKAGGQSDTNGTVMAAPGERYPGGDVSTLSKQPGVDLSQINPSMAANLTAMNNEYKEKAGKPFLITSGYRSIEKQAQLYREKGPKFAAPPGSSLHNFGVAVDVNSPDANAMASSGLLEKYNFTRPMGHEPWHIEPKGIDRKGVKKEGLKAAMAPDFVKQVATPSSSSSPADIDGDKTEANAMKAGGVESISNTPATTSASYSNTTASDMTTKYSSTSTANSNMITPVSSMNDSGPEIVSILTNIFKLLQTYKDDIGNRPGESIQSAPVTNEPTKVTPVVNNRQPSQVQQLPPIPPPAVSVARSV